jgi:hypothetical protein
VVVSSGRWSSQFRRIRARSRGRGTERGSRGLSNRRAGNRPSSKASSRPRADQGAEPEMIKPRRGRSKNRPRRADLLTDQVGEEQTK